MSKIIYAISVSLDGFVAGADDNPDQGMGRGGEALHQWAYQPDDTDTRILTQGIAGLGAHIVGRRMFDNALAWDGKPPGDLPCIVVTHRPPAQWTAPGSPFTFVGSVEEAVATGRDIAGDKDVAIGGGANIGRQALQAGLVDRRRRREGTTWATGPQPEGCGWSPDRNPSAARPRGWETSSACAPEGKPTDGSEQQ